MMNGNDSKGFNTASYEEVILEAMRKMPERSVKREDLMNDSDVEEIYCISPVMFDRAVKNLVLSGKISALNVLDRVTYTLKC